MHQSIHQAKINFIRCSLTSFSLLSWTDSWFCAGVALAHFCFLRFSFPPLHSDTEFSLVPFSCRSCWCQPETSWNHRFYVLDSVANASCFSRIWKIVSKEILMNDLFLNWPAWIFTFHYASLYGLLYGSLALCSSLEVSVHSSKTRFLMFFAVYPF